MKCFRIRFSLLVPAALLCVTAAHAQPVQIAPNSGSFSLPEVAPDGTALKVWTYRPPDLAPDDLIVIVMHGVRRNARTYRDTWVNAAQKHRLLILAPEMTQRQFPGNAGYSLGNMIDRKGQPQPSERWTWQLIERVFDAARAAAGSKRETYSLFGHSAGAQFVHRMVMFADNPRIEIAISANAGWYTLPAVSERFPYGLRDSPVDAKRVFARLARPMVVLLGSEDTNPEDANLRRTPAALRQGPNRVARGMHFFRLAEAEARRAQVPLAWRSAIVAGVDHDSRGMVAEAVAWIIGQRR